MSRTGRHIRDDLGLGAGATAALGPTEAQAGDGGTGRATAATTIAITTTKMITVATTTELAGARAEWLRLRCTERMKELVPVEAFNYAIDTLASHTLTALASIPARLYPYAQDLAEWRRCEQIVAQVRQELSAQALRRAGSLREIDGEGQELNAT